MTQDPSRHGNLALFSQLRWFVRLRWGAGIVVILGALADQFWLDQYRITRGALGIGAAILLYNAAFHSILRLRSLRTLRQGPLVTLAWAQIMLDLTCLTLLTLWTGGIHSPLLGFFVFHMVITSLLLPNRMAYLSAAASAAMLMGGLALRREWPAPSDGLEFLAGWVVTLLGTVYLASTIARDVRRHRLRLIRQNRRIRAMATEIRRQQQAMIQHEKMVAMGQMAAGVAHEVANPLACMDSMLQLAERKPDRMGPETVGKLRDQIRRITEIVRQLTNFAHPAQTRGEPAGVQDVIERALGMVRLDGRMGKVRLNLAIDPSLLETAVIEQSHALQQVLVNMILNALDATEGQPQPQLDIAATRGEGEYRIRIADNGHGIPPEQMARLFEPFFTTKPPGKGTGLGLAISYRLIRDHGGDIEVRSPGVGAAFTIRMPLPVRGQPPENPPAQDMIPGKP